MIPDDELQWSEAAKAIVPGEYEHYSGRRYQLIGVARNSETLEEVVVYEALYGDGNRWVRPLTMFFEDVEVNGFPQPRFKKFL